MCTVFNVFGLCKSANVSDTTFFITTIMAKLVVTPTEKRLNLINSIPHTKKKIIIDNNNNLESP